MVSLAENMAPGLQMEVSKSYLGPDYTIELEQEPTTYIEWQSIYPQNIPNGYELEYVGDRAYGQQSIEWKNQNEDVKAYIISELTMAIMMKYDPTRIPRKKKQLGVS